MAYAGKHADLVWQLFWAGASIVVRLPSVSGRSYQSNLVIGPQYSIQVHSLLPPLLTLLNLDERLHRSTRCPNIHLRFPHATHEIHALHHAAHGTPNQRPR
jgi:hypothetical protein